ncbi:hypothetical protein NKH36_26810 [Mesorhizobium sp. M1312]|uniref:hypothetical protein n=1 Tax=unclassified Mesorhizobium TaxID=325217 RepID=UPI0033380D0D
MANLGPIDDGLYASARASGGAIYPDGFAVIGRAENLENVHALGWDPNNHRIGDPEKTIVQQVENEQPTQLQQALKGWNLEEPSEKSNNLFGLRFAPQTELV